MDYGQFDYTTFLVILDLFVIATTLSNDIGSFDAGGGGGITPIIEESSSCDLFCNNNIFG